MTNDSLAELEAAALDGDPAALYVGELGARWLAAHLEPCPDCCAPWRAELLAGLWDATREHENTCPTLGGSL